MRMLGKPKTMMLEGDVSQKLPGSVRAQSSFLQGSET